MNKRRKPISIGTFLTYFTLTLVAVVTILPFLIVISTSFKTYGEAIATEFTLIPKELSFDGYNILFNSKNNYGESILISGFLNTMKIMILPVFGGTLVSSMAAFAFAKLNFTGREFLFKLLLATMMIPGTIILIPSYILYSYVGWVDTFKPLILPGLFGSAGTIFFLRQYFTGISSELLDAGKIDGLSYAGCFFRIFAPLAKAPICAHALLAFVGIYNDYMGPKTYLLNAIEKYPLQLVLTRFQQRNPVDFHAIMSSTIIVMIPTMIIYLLTQKTFIESVAAGGVKG